MKKFRFVALFLAMILACGTVFAADMDELDAEELAMLEAMSKEPPLTQADIDLLVKLSPSFESMGEDVDAISKLLSDNGSSIERFQFVMSKIGIGMMMAMMPEQITREMIAASGEVPEFLIPSDDEVGLITKNLDALQGMME